jgi:hypothetical protein
MGTTDFAANALVMAEKRQIVIFEAELLDDEIYFNLFWLFQDCNRIRAYLKQLWMDYHNGKVDRVTASVTTDTAIGLLQHADEQLISLWVQKTRVQTARRRVANPLALFYTSIFASMDNLSFTSLLFHSLSANV